MEENATINNTWTIWIGASHSKKTKTFLKKLQDALIKEFTYNCCTQRHQHIPNREDLAINNDLCELFQISAEGGKSPSTEIKSQVDLNACSRLNVSLQTRISTANLVMLSTDS